MTTRSGKAAATEATYLLLMWHKPCGGVEFVAAGEKRWLHKTVQDDLRGEMLTKVMVTVTVTATATGTAMATAMATATRARGRRAGATSCHQNNSDALAHEVVIPCLGWSDVA